MQVLVYDNSSGVEVLVDDQLAVSPTLIKFQPSAWNIPRTVRMKARAYTPPLLSST